FGGVTDWYQEPRLENQSPEYVPESDLEAHPEDDDDEDPEEDPVDYLADEGDDGDDEEGSSEDDKDDDMDIEADEEEEEEHPAPTDSIVIASTAADQAPSAEETEPFETDDPIRSLGYRAAIIRLRAEAASTSSPPLQPPSASRRDDKPEKLGIALGLGYEVGESSSAAATRPVGGLRADYGFGAPVSTDTELGGYMREFETRVRQDTDEIYMRLDDEQSERQLLAGRLNMLFRDRRAHAYTRHLMETEARMSREAWVRSTDASDLVRGEVMSLRTTILGQMTEIRELRAADRRRQTVISEMLRADYRVEDSPTGIGDSLTGIDASDLVRGEVMSLRSTILGQMTEIRELRAADRRRQTVISEMLRADYRVEDSPTGTGDSLTGI
nr:hypothetical protein [Tanacetum cinerariifolium]